MATEDPKVTLPIPEQVLVYADNLSYSEGYWRFKTRKDRDIIVLGLTFTDDEPMHYLVDNVLEIWRDKEVDETTFRILKGYMWDGASGPAIDTPGFIYSSQGHDVLYQAMRNNIVEPNERNRKIAEMVLDEQAASGHVDKLGVRRTMNKFRRWYVFKVLRWSRRARKSATPEGIHPVKMLYCRLGPRRHI